MTKRKVLACVEERHLLNEATTRIEYDEHPRSDKKGEHKDRKKLSTSLKNSNKCLLPPTTKCVHKSSPKNEGETHNMCEPLIAGLVDNDHNIFCLLSFFLPTLAENKLPSYTMSIVSLLRRPFHSLFIIVPQIFLLPFFLSMSKHNHKFSSRLPIFFYNNTKARKH